MVACSTRKPPFYIVSPNFVFLKRWGPLEKKFEYGPLHNSPASLKFANVFDQNQRRSIFSLLSENTKFEFWGIFLKQNSRKSKTQTRISKSAKIVSYCVDQQKSFSLFRTMFMNSKRCLHQVGCRLPFDNINLH